MLDVLRLLSLKCRLYIKKKSTADPPGLSADISLNRFWTLTSMKLKRFSNNYLSLTIRGNSVWNYPAPLWVSLFCSPINKQRTFLCFPEEMFPPKLKQEVSCLTLKLPLFITLTPCHTVCFWCWQSSLDTEKYSVFWGLLCKCEKNKLNLRSQ